MLRLCVIILLIGCYSPSYRDCEVSCAGGTCPAGLSCLDNVCRLPGMTGACGVVDVDAPTLDGSRDIPVDQLFDAQLSTYCAFLVRCGATEAVQSCVESFKNVAFPLVVGGLDRQVAAVRAGMVIYHPDKAQACIDAVAGFSCDRSVQSNLYSPLACEQVFEGLVTNAGTCIINEQCVSHVCTITSCPNACCTGTCTGSSPPAMKNLSEACTSHDRCVNSYCDSATGVCTAFKGGTLACTSSVECAPGNSCRTSGPGNICQALSGTNGPCSTNADCMNVGDVCRNGSCMTGGLSSTCGSVSECQPWHQCTGSACKLYPTLTEACSPNVGCRVGYCGSGTCIPKLADGAVCDPLRNGVDCAGGVCDAQGKCASRPTCF